MLFTGPPASGKGTAALELARVLSCGEHGAWNCPCGSCAMHRYLIHQDLLLLGPRRFSAETAAAGAGLLREPESPAALILFVRSVRKLLARFSPVLWEDDPALGKLTPLIQSMEDELDALSRGEGKKEDAISSLVKSSLKLENDGIGETIPIAHIRRAAFWSRFAASGKMKFILIENADRMQEGARNSLLKILEEPPERVSIVLTTAVRGAILPTIQSRLRPYRFVRRDPAAEAEVVRRIFRGVPAGGGLAGFLDSFLPLPDEKLLPLAALFTASIARLAAADLRRRKAEPPLPLSALGKYAAAASPDSPGDIRGSVTALIDATGNFEGRSFTRFLAALLDTVSASARESAADPEWIACKEIWREASRGAAEAVGIWNQTPALALERMALELRGSMARL
jgi:DNA polymerase-3 subunit gamma/tau